MLSYDYAEWLNGTGQHSRFSQTGAETTFIISQKKCRNMLQLIA